MTNRQPPRHPLVGPWARPAAVLTVVLVGFALVGCATPYQPMGFRGGYKDVRLDEAAFRVEVRGNGYTRSETVQNYLLYRCAEITVQNGYDYFVIVAAGVDTRVGAFTTPGSYTSTTTGFASAYGNTVSGSATTTGTYTPPQTFYVPKHSASAIIRIFRGERPSDLPSALDAHKVLEYMRSEVNP